MRSDKNQLNVVARGQLQPTRQVVCLSCREAIIGGTSRTVVDDNGSLAITAWSCSKCGGVIEEIRLLAQDGTARPRPIRYAVVPQLQV
jgi:hypothetical protein